MTTPLLLSSLPPELLHQILTNLDIPDLLTLTRTTHSLRILSIDPLLHLLRLRRASYTIETYLPSRPPLTKLMHDRIYITRTTAAARALGRDLVRIRLTRLLDPRKRESVGRLVERGVLPGECWILNSKDRTNGKTGELDSKSGINRNRIGGANTGGYLGGLAPSLVETKRKIERERIRDFLRGWVEEWQKRGWESHESSGVDQEERSADVRRLVRWFTKNGKEREGVVMQRWGREAVKKRREEPTRAKVLGLRRFWENLARESARV